MTTKLMKTDFNMKLRPQQVETRDLTSEYHRDDQNMRSYDDVIRVYQSGPTYACIQLRSFGRTTRHGKKRRILTHADFISAEELDQLIDHLKTIRKEISV